MKARFIDCVFSEIMCFCVLLPLGKSVILSEE